MPPPPTFNSALAVWGISRVGSSALQAPYLLAQSRDSIKRRYRELARSWHPDVVRGGGAAPAGGGISDGGGSGSSEEEGKPDLDWLRAARDKLLENLMVEQARDRQRLAEAQRSEQQNQLAAAGNFLAQLADRRQECGKQWDVPAASLQLRFILQEWQAGQHACRYLGVALSGGGRSTTALVTKNGFLLDEPIEQADHMRGLAFAHELLTLQQACNERGWPLQQVAGGSLCVRVDSHHSACFGAQQLVDGTATATVLQAALDAEPNLPARAARTAGTAGSAPAPATAARRDRGLGSTASQPTPAPGTAQSQRRPMLTVAQRMMQAAAASAAAADCDNGRELIKEVAVRTAFMSHCNFSISLEADVPKLLGDEWDGQETMLDAEDTQEQPCQLRVKLYTEVAKQLYRVRKVRIYFPRSLLRDNEVRLGQRLQIWRTAAGGLQLKFLDPEPATKSSGSGSSGAGGSRQHSTGSKRARRQ